MVFWVNTQTQTNKQKKTERKKKRNNQAMNIIFLNNSK